MKQIKTLMVAALTLMMGVMMTSCLNSEGGESLYDGYFLAKVVYAGGMVGGATFEDAGGNRYEASYTSVSQLESSGADLSNMEMAMAMSMAFSMPMILSPMLSSTQVIHIISA